MTSINKTTILPDILRSINGPAYEVVEDATRVRFYFRGGGNIIAIKRMTKDLWTIFVPPFSNIKYMDSDGVLETHMDKILDEMDVCKVKNDSWFLYDITTQRILTNDSFIEFIPSNTIKSAVVLLDDDKGNSPYIYYFTDKSDYGLSSILSLLIAKMELSKPKTGRWNSDSKMLLHYLVAHTFDLNVNFRSTHGSWEGCFFDLSKGTQRKGVIDLTKVKLTAARSKAKTYENDEQFYMALYNGGEIPSNGNTIIMLSDLLQIGLDHILKGADDKIDVEIDIEKNTYSTIHIDVQASVCFVKLTPGCTKTLSDVMSELGSDSIQFLTD